MACSTVGNLREFKKETTCKGGSRILGRYRETVQPPRVEGAVTTPRPGRPTAGSSERGEHRRGKEGSRRAQELCAEGRPGVGLTHSSPPAEGAGRASTLTSPSPAPPPARVSCPVCPGQRHGMHRGPRPWPQSRVEEGRERTEGHAGAARAGPEGRPPSAVVLS